MITDAELPVPTDWTVAGGCPAARSKTPRTASTSAGAAAVVDGNWICVPPVKSMPRLNPRNTIDATQTSTSTEKPMYQIFLRPTMSNAPVPV